MKKLIICLCCLMALWGCQGNAQENLTTSTPSSTEDTMIFTSEDENTEIPSSAVQITFDQDVVTTTGKNVEINGTTVTLKEATTYVLSGTSSDGQIVVDCTTEGVVHLVLDQLDLTSTTSSPLVIVQADKTIVTVVDGTKSTLQDAANRDEASQDYDGVISASDDLTINGTGTLVLKGNYADGIEANDAFVAIQTTLNITTVDHGINVNDSIAMKEVTCTIEAGGDGIRATNDTDVAMGTIYLASGTYTLNTGEDGIQGETLVEIQEGSYTITTKDGMDESVMAASATFPEEGMKGERPTGDFNFENRGPMNDTMTEATQDPSASMDPANRPQRETNPEPTTPQAATETSSAKGIKASQILLIHGGTFVLNTYDDALHSNGNLTIEDGTFTIQTSDDAIHGEEELLIQAGTIQIDQCYEGLEANVVTIQGGTITLTAVDDGINATTLESNPGLIQIEGGTVEVHATGDGLDANGSIVMTDGTLTIYGSLSSNEGGLDYDSTCTLSGGELWVLDQAGMSQSPSTNSTIKTVRYGSNTLQEGDEVAFYQNGQQVASITLPATYTQVQWASAIIQEGTIEVWVNGTKVTEATVSDTLTSLGETTPANFNQPGMNQGPRP